MLARSILICVSSMILHASSPMYIILSLLAVFSFGTRDVCSLEVENAYNKFKKGCNQGQYTHIMNLYRLLISVH
jgi:hypothetical protein